MAADVSLMKGIKARILPTTIFVVCFHVHSDIGQWSRLGNVSLWARTKSQCVRISRHKFASSAFARMCPNVHCTCVTAAHECDVGTHSPTCITTMCSAQVFIYSLGQEQLRRWLPAQPCTSVWVWVCVFFFPLLPPDTSRPTESTRRYWNAWQKSSSFQLSLCWILLEAMWMWAQGLWQISPPTKPPTAVTGVFGYVCVCLSSVL